jgi:glycosyltransferase involved in cell wall biosynthesis
MLLVPGGLHDVVTCGWSDRARSGDAQQVLADDRFTGPERGDTRQICPPLTPWRTFVRLGLVHERFTEYAGSERVVGQLAREWPAAQVFAPVALEAGLPPGVQGRVRGDRLTRFVRRGGGYAHLLPLLPLSMRRLPLRDLDVVLASHHAFADQVVHATDAPVVAYVHSPARWVWDSGMRAGEAGGAGGAAVLSAFAAAYRGPDRRAAQRLHTVVANSRAVARRIEDWWERSALVVPPPVDTGYYTPDPSVPREDFFLLAGRLVPYKRAQVAVAAAAKAGVRLVVAGDGRSRDECERVAGPHTTFLGRVDDETQRDLYRRCAALLMPGEEDFGIVPVEAQATGAPVIASAAGGALDTVLPARTGVLVPTDATVSEAVGTWATALRDFDPGVFDPTLLRRHAEGFSQESFRAVMRRVVEGVLAPVYPVEPTAATADATPQISA